MRPVKHLVEVSDAVGKCRVEEAFGGCADGPAAAELRDAVGVAVAEGRFGELRRTNRKEQALEDNFAVLKLPPVGGHGRNIVGDAGQHRVIRVGVVEGRGHVPGKCVEELGVFAFERAKSEKLRRLLRKRDGGQLLAEGAGEGFFEDIFVAELFVLVQGRILSERLPGDFIFRGHVEAENPVDRRVILPERLPDLGKIIFVHGILLFMNRAAGGERRTSAPHRKPPAAEGS